MTLGQLVGPNGFVRYHSTETDLGWGRATEGKALVRFTLAYVLDPTSATDKREQIIVRLMEVCANHANHVRRNDLNVSDAELPAIIVFDADEGLDPIEEDRRREASARRIVQMIPEIAILVQADQAQVGSELNRIRTALINAITADS